MTMLHLGQLFFCLLLLHPSDCSTTFIIRDCDNIAVVGASVTVERCTDKKLFTSVTNSKGEATFPLCKTTICRVKVAYAGYATKDIKGNIGENCKGDQNANCDIKICSD